eukprot:352449-Chlamydomonas_euryale.AAC.2
MTCSCTHVPRGSRFQRLGPRASQVASWLASVSYRGSRRSYLGQGAQSWALGAFMVAAVMCRPMHMMCAEC